MSTGYDVKYAQAFFALSEEERLAKVIENSFPSWVRNANEGVSLVYAKACEMIEAVTEKIFETDEAHLGGFEIFSSSTAHEVETGYDLYNPDTGGQIEPVDGKDGYFYMMETGIMALSRDDAKFEPKWLVPEDPAVREPLVKKYGRVFSTQLRFWAHDADEYQARYDAFKASLKEFPNVKIAEKQFDAALRKKNRFRIKKKETIELVETKVTGIAIGLEL